MIDPLIYFLVLLVAVVCCYTMNMKEHNEQQPASAAEMKEWVKEVHGIYAGLIAIGIVMIQPFMYQNEYIGTAAIVCVVSFAICIPLLAALLLLNFSEDFHRHLSDSKAVAVVRAVGQIAGGTGVIAGFWHINPVAGMVSAVGCVLGLVVYTVGYEALSRKRRG